MTDSLPPLVTVRCFYGPSCDAWPRTDTHPAPTPTPPSEMDELAAFCREHPECVGELYHIPGGWYEWWAGKFNHLREHQARAYAIGAMVEWLARQNRDLYLLWGHSPSPLKSLIATCRRELEGK